MESLLEKYGWKKTGIAVVIVCLLVIGFAAISFFQIDSQSLESAKKAVSERLGNFGVEREGAFQSVYTDEYYSIAIPQDFYVKKYTPSPGNISSVVIADSSETRIKIDVTPSSSSSIEALSGQFESLGYKRTEDLLPIGPVVLYEGSIDEVVALYEKVALIDKNGITIRVILSAFGGVQPDKIRIFDSMIRSIR